MTEAQIHSQIQDYLKARKIVYWRMPVGLPRKAGGIRGKSPLTGFPDIAGLYCGRFFALEIKVEKGKVSDQQETWIRNLLDNGAFVSVVRSLDDAIGFLKFIDISTKEPAYARIPIINL